MKRNSTARVVMSRKVYNQIKDSVVNANNDYEVGGVLLGYKKSFGCYYIAATTIATEIAEKSKISFTLNGDWHTTRALELMQAFRRKPSILGIWHSHICGSGVFSEQDRRSNEQLAISFNGALSMLVMMSTPLQNLSLTAYFITPWGKEKPFRVEIINGRNQYDVSRNERSLKNE